MKKKIIIISLLFILCFTAVAFASSVTPGSEADPVVSKSYLDSKITEMKAYVDEKVISGGTTGGNSVFTVVELKVGASLIGGESAEIILRSGDAIIVAGVDSVPNLTSGKAYKNGEKVATNNLILIPRNDGRGIKITGSSSAWVMVKGEYTIR